MVVELADFVLVDNELQKRLEAVDWPSVLTELYAYAQARSNYLGMSHYAAPQDLVNDAVARVLAGERKWDYDKFPDLTIYLKSVIKSLTNQAWESEKANRRRDESVKQSQDCHSAQSQMDETNAEAFHRSLLNEIEETLADDEELLLLYYAMKEGHLKDQDLAEELGVEITAVRNAKKRMRRKLTDVKQRLG